MSEKKSLSDVLLGLALAPLRRVLGSASDTSPLHPGMHLHEGPGQGRPAGKDVLLVLHGEDIPAALALAAARPGIRTLTIDPGVFDPLIRAGLPNVAYLAIDGAPGYDILYDDARDAALSFETSLQQAAGSLLAGVGSFSWAYLHLFHLVRMQRWYAAVAPQLARYLRGSRVILPVNDNPATFYWPSFVPSAVLAEAFGVEGIELIQHPCAAREDETWALPDLAGMRQVPVGILAHLPTATHDHAFLQDALTRCGEPVLLFQAKYWQPALTGFETVGLTRVDEMLARLPAEVGEQANAFRAVAAECLDRWLQPLLPAPGLRARQADRLASLYFTQYVFLSSLRACFAKERPHTLLLSSHDCDFHGPLVSWAESMGLRVLMFPHSKTVPHIRFPARLVEVLCHPIQERDIVDPAGQCVRRIPLTFPREAPQAPRAGLRRLGLLLNALSITGTTVTAPGPWLAGIRQLAEWCRARGIILHVRSRPGLPLLRLLHAECGLVPEDVVACTDIPLADFAAMVDACVMYDAPTAAALPLMEAGLPVLHVLSRPLADYEAVTAHRRLTPPRTPDEAIALLDALAEDDDAFQRFYTNQSTAYNALLGQGHALHHLLQEKEPMRDPLNDLTIVVPTNTRHEFLARLLTYYADLPVTVVVMDGSKEAFDTSPFEGRACRLRYQHMPVPIIERLRHAATLVDTPCVMLSCDDEYYLLDGLRNCVTTLQNDASLSAVNGRCAAFVTNDEGVQLGLYYDFLRGYEDRSPLASERLRKVAGVPPITSGFYYSMMRLDAYRGAVSQAFRRPYASPYVQELLFSTCLFMQGQVTTINDVVWLRNLDNPPVTHANWNRKKTVAEWFSEPGSQEEVLDMLGSLAAFYAPYAAPGQDSFTLPDFFNAILAFDQKASAGEVPGDVAYPFQASIFERLCRAHGIPLDSAALRRVEDIEIDAQLRKSAALQNRAAITVW